MPALKLTQTHGTGSTMMKANNLRVVFILLFRMQINNIRIEKGSIILIKIIVIRARDLF